MTSQPDRFSPGVRESLVDARTVLMFSAASAWEIAIKYALGKLRLPDPPPQYVSSRLRETRMTPLGVCCEHALRVSELPAHHRDPFDRLLVAQAQIEKVPLLTADPLIARYDVEIVHP